MSSNSQTGRTVASTTNMNTSIIYLFGPPAVGKYTVACAIAQRNGAVVVDNQLINHPIFSLFKWDGRFQLPSDIMNRTVPIREAVLSTIEESCPEAMSYVFTNQLSDSASARDMYARIKRIAVTRGSTFLPVMLTCEPEEQMRRVENADRVARLKIADASWVRDYMQSNRSFEPADTELIKLDTTTLAPETAAEEILRCLGTDLPQGE